MGDRLSDVDQTQCPTLKGGVFVCLQWAGGSGACPGGDAPVTNLTVVGEAGRQVNR